MRVHAVYALSAGVTSLLLWCGSAYAASPQTQAAGKPFYMKYCASCHGADGKGNGPAASAMKTPPSDLTQLAKKHGGKFPYVEVLDIIDGESPRAGHGSAEMPAWGETFQSDAPSGAGDPGSQAQVRGRLMLLTDYLRSIQQK